MNPKYKYKLLTVVSVSETNTSLTHYRLIIYQLELPFLSHFIGILKQVYHEPKNSKILTSSKSKSKLKVAYRRSKKFQAPKEILDMQSHFCRQVSNYSHHDNYSLVFRSWKISWSGKSPPIQRA